MLVEVKFLSLSLAMTLALVVQRSGFMCMCLCLSLFLSLSMLELSFLFLSLPLVSRLSLSLSFFLSEIVLVLCVLSFFYRSHPDPQAFRRGKAPLHWSQPFHHSILSALAEGLG